MARPRKRWTYSTGRRPFTVTVEELEPGGNIYSRIWIPERQDYKYRSLRHRDRTLAMEHADRMTVQLREGEVEIVARKLTLEDVFKLYEKHRTPQKAIDTQGEDERRAELFLRVLGKTREPSSVSRADWERFIKARSSGAIDPRGRPVLKANRRAVRNRTVEADLCWIKAVFTWCVNWQLPDGRYVLSENPVRGFATPTEKNPRRVVATQDRFDAVRAVSDRVLREDLSTGRRLEQRSYLSELLDIVNGTGRRISAVCRLRYEDLRLDDGPHGAIRWPADSDKMGFEGTVPIGPDVRRAIDRVLSERPGIGRAFLFPSPLVPDAPLRYELAGDWLKTAEKMAGLETQDGTLWHAYRRKWATERKHLPGVDVAAAGGWKCMRTLDIYQRPDAATMLRVVLEAGELREHAR